MDDKVLEVLVNVTKLPKEKILENMDSTELWDSFNHVELIIMLENEFNISFEENEIAEMHSPAKVVEYVNAKVS